MSRQRPLPTAIVVAPPAPAPQPSPVAPAAGELDALAVATGQAWAASIVDELRGQDRDVSGGWPGVVREARARLALALGRQRTLVPAERFEALARAAYASARTLWSAQAAPDQEP